MYRKIAIVSAALAMLSVAPAHALVNLNGIGTINGLGSVNGLGITNGLAGNALAADNLGTVIAIELPQR